MWLTTRCSKYFEILLSSVTFSAPGGIINGSMESKVTCERKVSMFCRE